MVPATLEKWPGSGIWDPNDSICFSHIKKIPKMSMKGGGGWEAGPSPNQSIENNNSLQQDSVYH